jgi:orotate phosphoribosyltransferase
MIGEIKKPKIRLVMVGEGPDLDEIVSKIKEQCAEWGYELFKYSGVESPHYEAIITILKDKKGKIDITATIGEEKVELKSEDFETFIISLMNKLFFKLRELQRDKVKFEEELRRLALDIFDIGEIKTNGPYTFKLHEENPDAPKSPIYIGLRVPPKGTLTDEMVESIGSAFFQLCLQNHIECDCVAGVPKAGDPFAKVLSRLAGVPQIFLEKEITEKGRRILPIIKGGYTKGTRILIVDNVLVRAYSAFETISALLSNGLIVKDILVFVDWEHGGTEKLKEAGHNVFSVFKVRDLVSLYNIENRISIKINREFWNYLKAARAYFGEVYII